MLFRFETRSVQVQVAFMSRASPFLCCFPFHVVMRTSARIIRLTIAIESSMIVICRFDVSVED